MIKKLYNYYLHEDGYVVNEYILKIFGITVFSKIICSEETNAVNEYMPSSIEDENKENLIKAGFKYENKDKTTQS